MDRTIKTLACLATMTACVFVFGWTNGFYLMSGAIVLGVVVPVVFLFFRSRSAEPTGEDEFATPIRSLFFGLAIGLGLVACLGGTFWVLKKTPIYDKYCDRDQERFEERLSTLEEAGNYSRAAELIAERLEGELSDSWERVLAERWYTNLVSASESCDASARLDYLVRALGVANEYGLEATSARALMQRVKQEDARNKTLAGLHEAGEWLQLTESLRTFLLDEPNSRELAERLYQAYMDWAAACAELEDKKARYADAASIAKEHRIEPDPATVALELVELATNDRMKHERQIDEFEELRARAIGSLVGDVIGLSKELPNTGVRRQYLLGIGDLLDELKLDRGTLALHLEATEAVLSSEQALEESIMDLSSRGEFEELVQLLESKNDQHPRASQFLHQAYIDWAKACDALEDKKRCYENAAAVALQHKISNSTAAESLRVIGWLIAEQATASQQAAEAARLQQRLCILVDSVAELVVHLKDPQQQEQYLSDMAKILKSLGLDDARLAERLKSAKLGLEAKEAFKDHVSELRQRKAYEELIALLQRSRNDKEKQSWGYPLDLWLYEALLAWGRTEGDLETRISRHNEIIGVCKDCELDPSVPQHGLQQALAAKALQQQTLSRVRSFLEDGKYAELVAYLRFRIGEGERKDWDHPLDRWLLSALTEWGMKETDLEAKVRIYQDAVDVGKRFELETSAAVAELTKLRAMIAERDRIERERNAPVAMPVDAEAQIVRIWTEALPAIAIDVWVGQTTGNAIENLLAKDFTLAVNGNRAEFVLASLEREGTPLHVVLLLDTSESVEPVFAMVKRASAEFLRRLGGANTAVKLIPFNSLADESGEWTTDVDSVIRSLDTVTPSGKTALNTSVLAAVEALRGKAGDKCVVVFTDGKDTVGGAKLADVVSACRRESVSVYAIGLRTDSLDAASMKKLAMESGGDYSEAKNASELIDKYLITSTRLRQSLYRIVATAAPKVGHSPVEIEVTIGGERSIKVTGKSN